MSFLNTENERAPSGARTRKSIVLALVVLLGLGAAVYWFYGRAPEPEPVVETEPEPVVVEETPEPEPPPSRELPSTGALSVRANVEGASVYVDGEYVGQVPFENVDIAIGRYEVKVEKDGFEPFVRNIRVRPGRRAELSASLDVLPPSLRIESDVAGATVFLDRNYVGTTPVDIEAVEPGEHQLTVSAEGYDMHSEKLTVTEGHRDVRVSFKKAAATLNESIAVVHKHTFGDCAGTLVADENGIRYATDHKDAFTASYGSLERFEIDYIDKNLNLKIRGGKNYNFTEASGDADALFVFHRNVQEFMGKM